jgi:hypothetical protein
MLARMHFLEQAQKQLGDQISVTRNAIAHTRHCAGKTSVKQKWKKEERNNSRASVVLNLGSVCISDVATASRLNVWLCIFETNLC